MLPSSTRRNGPFSSKPSLDEPMIHPTGGTNFCLSVYRSYPKKFARGKINVYPKTFHVYIISVINSKGPFCWKSHNIFKRTIKHLHLAILLVPFLKGLLKTWPEIKRCCWWPSTKRWKGRDLNHLACTSFFDLRKTIIKPVELYTSCPERVESGQHQHWCRPSPIVDLLTRCGETKTKKLKAIKSSNQFFIFQSWKSFSFIQPSNLLLVTRLVGTNHEKRSTPSTKPATSFSFPCASP